MSTASEIVSRAAVSEFIRDFLIQGHVVVFKLNAVRRLPEAAAAFRTLKEACLTNGVTALVYDRYTGGGGDERLIDVIDGSVDLAEVLPIDPSVPRPVHESSIEQMRFRGDVVPSLAQLADAVNRHFS